MKNIGLGIEISEEVIKSKVPSKIQRYDLVPRKELKKETKMLNTFYGHKPEMAKYWIRGENNV